MRREKLKDYYGPGGSRRYECLPHVNLPDLSVVQFGVFSGSSIAAIHEKLKDGAGYSKIWGFDSFVGLPNETKNVPIDMDWNKGAFDATEWFEMDKPDDIIDRLYAEFIEFGIPYYKIELIKGWFSDTLTDELAEEVGKLSYVDIDSDLYISCYQALDWIFRNDLHTKGTVIYYDDWGSGKSIGAGEYLAHKELTQKYNIQYDWIHEGGSSAIILK